MAVDLDSVRSNDHLEIRSRKKKKRDRGEYVCFSNSVSIVFNGSKSLKIFSNGRLHCTGCKTIAEAESYVSEFIGMMPGWSSKGVSYSPFSIVMLNTCIRMKPMCVSLDGINRAINAKTTLFTRYNPDIYQALVVKVPCTTQRKVTMMIFYTGTVIVAGVRSPSELRQACDAVLPFVVSDVASSFSD
jgi:TATA-box binding protein (TBP) (component of TFIID and TFIIIB)